MKGSLLVAAGLVLGALGAAGVVTAASSRTTDTARTFVHFGGSMNSAGSKILFEDGEFRIKGKCVDLGGGVFRAQPVIRTKSDNAAFNSSNGDANDQDWDIADGFKKLQADGRAAQGSSGAPDFADHSDPSWFAAIKSNGNVVDHGFVWSSAFHGPKCRWGGYIERAVVSS